MKTDYKASNYVGYIWTKLFFSLIDPLKNNHTYATYEYMSYSFDTEKQWQKKN